MNSAISLITKVIERGANIAEVYVDTVGPPEKYQAKLSEIFPNIKITVSSSNCKGMKMLLKIFALEEMIEILENIVILAL